MNSPRRTSREAALQILFSYDTQTEPPAGAVLAASMDKHFRHFDIAGNSREFCAELVSGTLRRRPELDETIEKMASNWKVSRMPIIDRNLLRLSVNEMLHFRDTPPSVIIDEAVELAKAFGEAETPAFVNGILDNLRKQHRPNDPVKPAH